MGAGQYALSLVTDPESSQVTNNHYSSLTNTDLNFGFVRITNFVRYVIVLFLGPRRVDSGFLKIAWLTSKLNDRFYCITFLKEQ